MAFVDFTGATVATPTAPPATPPTSKNPPKNPGGINSIGTGAPIMAPDASDEAMAEFCVNLNDKMVGRPPVKWRTATIMQMAAVLISMGKSNVLLYGLAGCGKTAVVEELARLIAEKDPMVKVLDGYTIYNLELSGIVAGGGIVGDIEKRVKGVVEFCSKPSNKAILFIDEIHLIVENKIYATIAQILKPAMARGQIKVIGATTTQEVGSLATDPAFSRRFSRIPVEELTPEQTEEILTDMIPETLAHYGTNLVIDPTIAHETVACADRFSAPGSHRPDNAITLWNRVMAEAVVARAKQEADAQNQLSANLQQAITQGIAQRPIPITVKALKRTAMKIMTGNSVEKTVMRNELEDALTPIKGQEKSLSSIVDVLERRSLGLFDADEEGARTPTSMLIAGDSGTGKSETGKILARTLTGQEKPIFLNMAEYKDSASLSRITGSSAGYVGYDDHVELPFDALDTNPYQVVILDEFEKAAPGVQRLFMSALEEGYFKTARGKLVDFSHAIIIATTNAGHAGKVGRKMGFGSTDTAEAEREELVDVLSGWFDLELLNRFDLICAFDSISKRTYTEIVRSLWERNAKIANETPDCPPIPDEIDDETLKRIVDETYVHEFGARPAKAAVRRAIEDVALGRKAQD